MKNTIRIVGAPGSVPTTLYMREDPVNRLELTVQDGRISPGRSLRAISVALDAVGAKELRDRLDLFLANAPPRRARPAWVDPRRELRTAPGGQAGESLFVAFERDVMAQLHRSLEIPHNEWCAQFLPPLPALTIGCSVTPADELTLEPDAPFGGAFVTMRNRWYSGRVNLSRRDVREIRDFVRHAEPGLRTEAFCASGSGDRLAVDRVRLPYSRDRSPRLTFIGNGMPKIQVATNAVSGAAFVRYLDALTARAEDRGE